MFVRVELGIFLFVLFITVTMVVVSQYSIDQIQFSYRQWSKFDDGRILLSRSSNTTCNVTSSSSQNSSSQYLWCVNHYGPNNQLKDFVKCCIIAIINNYTVIIPPLYPHHSDRMRGIQWFDHFYDLKQLGLALNFITIDQFMQQLKSKQKKVMIDCYIQQIDLVADRMWYPRNTLISIQNAYKTSINFHRYRNLSRNFDMNELFNEAKNCSSIFLHIHYMKFNHFFSYTNNHSQQIFEHLSRTALIQSMALQLINLLPQLIIGNFSKNQTKTILAVAHLRLGDHVVMSVSMYIKQILHLIHSGIRFTHLHIMCPYLNSTDINQLTSSLPVAITTTKQIFNHVRFVLNDYLFDVLEQEIAFQASIFIGSPWTTYSATVVMQKVYQQKGIVYLFSTKRDSHPFLVTKKNVKYFD